MNANFYNIINRFFFLFIFVSMFYGVHAQDVELRSQADVDAFNPTTTVINGSLLVGEQFSSVSDIDDISNLSNLTSIVGDLIISRNINFTNLDEFSSLNSIGGYLSITTNANLANIDGLSNLTSIGTGENLIIFRNNSLTNLDGLSNVSSAVDILRIFDNEVLTNIDGLGNIISVEGELEIEDNESLLTIDGLENITTVESDILINGNTNLGSVNGFANLIHIGGSILISENENLLNIIGLNNLTTIGADVLISNNVSLFKVDGFNSLEDVGFNLAITDNSSLESVNGMSNLISIGSSLRLANDVNLLNVDFNNLVTIGSNLEIRDNARLVSIGNVNNLTTVGQSIILVNNGSLESLVGLSSLITVGASLTIQNNGLLVNVDGLNMTSSVGSSLSIRNNVSLLNLEGLNSLNSIGFDFAIIGNDTLTNISGVNNLSSIGGNLTVSSNDNLINTELNNLLTIGGSLVLQQNINLISISGLTNLTSISGGINIVNNDKLEDLDGLNRINYLTSLNILNNAILENLDHLIAMDSVGGDLSIRSNAGITHLEGLRNIAAVRGFLRVSSNFNLEDCCGIQDLLENEDTAIDSLVIIFSNPSQCSTQQEVLEAPCDMNFTMFLSPPCIGESNGSIQIYVEKYESTPFTYQWMREGDGATGNGVSQSDEFIIDMLSSGTYNITVTTPTPEIAIEIDVELTQLDGNVFELLEVTTVNSGNGESNGSITLTTEGGVAPYTYSWSGVSDGSVSNISTDSYTISGLKYGEYSVTIVDANGAFTMIELTLLDEEVEVIPCEEPLDIIILNDVSGSVDEIEYKESKQFFVDFLKEVNIGFDADNSRAAIIEWSSHLAHNIQFSFTGDSMLLQTYKDSSRSFYGGTAPHSAMQFARSYMEANARPDVDKVIVLSTDGTGGQISSSLVALADQFKAEGYHIISIAFDAAYAEDNTREILRKVASIDVLAPGAPAYSLLDENIAENIVNNYLCPLNTGSSATAYFSRDGEIEITNIVPLGDCPNPGFVELTIDISAYRELSFPAGTPVTFYHNNPNQAGATSILTWLIPCAIPVGTTETYFITLPLDNPSNIFAVLNDDGIQGPPISFPITELEELAYSNNIDNRRICQNGDPTIQVLKYSASTLPSCDTIVNYTINVCNISEVDAFGVTVTDNPPDGFVLTGSVLNDNGCAISVGDAYDIPADCCFSLLLTYDAAFATQGYYGDQGVDLDGPAGQTYYDFDGSTTTDEDVNIDGSIDCPSSIIEFTKTVNVNESCDDSYVEFTFTINNEMNIPLQGLTFSDILPDPCTWVFMPYGESGLSIGDVNLSGNTANFTIDEVAANTVATFSMDASLNFWDNDGILNNTATLDNVPDVINGGFTTLTSNTTSTQITAAPSITIPDTIIVSVGTDTLDLFAMLSSPAELYWTSSGDGEFIDSTSETATYIVGIQDAIDGEVLIFISAVSDCNESGTSVVVIFEDCSIFIDIIEIGECDTNGTPFDGSDDIYNVIFTVTGDNVEPNSMFVVSVDSFSDTLTYFSEHTISLPVDGSNNMLTFVDLDFKFCSIEVEVTQEICTEECLITSVDNLVVYDCNDNGTPLDSTDDYYVVEFTAPAYNPGEDNAFITIYNGITEGPFVYGDLASLTLSADSLLDSILIVDSNVDTCDFWLVVNQDNCYSEDCYDNLTTISIEEVILSDCELFDATLSVFTNVIDTLELIFTWTNVNGDILGVDEILEIDQFGDYFVSVAYCDETITDSIQVISDPNVELEWPKVFFPNGMEELNKTFGPYIECDALVTDYSLKIYNRWGNEVFVSNNIEDEWDGQHRGVNSASAVYVFVAQYTINGIRQPVYKGDVTLLRN